MFESVALGSEIISRLVDPLLVSVPPCTTWYLLSSSFLSGQKYSFWSYWFSSPYKMHVTALKYKILALFLIYLFCYNTFQDETILCTSFWIENLYKIMLKFHKNINLIYLVFQTIIHKLTIHDSDQAVYARDNNYKTSNQDTANQRSNNL